MRLRPQLVARFIRHATRHLSLTQCAKALSEEGKEVMGLQPVESVGIQGTGGMSTAPASKPAEATAAQTSAGASSTTSMTSSTSAMMIHSRVDEFLSSFGSELQSDQQLRMIIGLLILQALLGNDRKESDVQGGELMTASLVASMLDGGKNEAAIISETNIVQIQQQSTLVMTDQAIQTLADDGSSIGGEDSPGSRLDVTS